eukprot:scaffold285076_cov25-Prasinocladus_malaysianus.AAC.1
MKVSCIFVALPTGKESTDALAAHLGKDPVQCTVRDVDQYGRLVSSCTAGREDIGHWLVSNGYAVAYTQFSDMYEQDEKAAASSRRGL